MAETSPDPFPLTDADRCVMCGLCLPHCPTYRLSNREGESPRGRVALMRAMASGELPVTPQLVKHLDSCLACRACEMVCPAEVPYGKLIDAARALLLGQQERMGKPLAEPDRVLNALGRLEQWRPLLRLYQQSGLQRIARTLQIPKALGAGPLERLLPPLPRRPQWQEYYPAVGEERGRVALFAGCTGKALDDVTLQASIKILTLLGYSVTIPTGQTCCGALHLHGGRPREARELALTNMTAFQTEQMDAIIYTASACGVQLAEYPGLPGLEKQERAAAERFSGKAREICQFIDTAGWPPQLQLEPLEETAAIHIPCSLQHPHHRPGTVRALLKRIPQLTLTPLPGNTLCCGAAGDYLLRHPDTADTLITPKLNALKEIQATILVTANIGCALHFRAALREKGQSVEVIHPVTLLARQLTRSR